MRNWMYGVLTVLLFGVSTADAQKPLAPVTSAQGVASAKGDQIVKLRGEIVQKRSGNEYVFSDGTGTVIVQIGEKLLNGRTIPSGTQVEIVGEIDKGILRQSKVAARSVTVLASSDRDPLESVM